MSKPSPSQVTRILRSLQDEGTDKSEVTERLLALVYDELRQIAARIMSRERVNHTLQPTALVHEVYLKLVDQNAVAWNDRAHFLGIAARAMRQILVDHARGKGAAKRGSGWQQVTLDEELTPMASSEIELLDLNDALDKLTAVDERAGRVAELRLFGGMTVKETAHVLGVSRRTVDDDWAMARLWLSREMSG